MINLHNAGQYVEHFLKIRTKSGTLAPLVLNAPQKKLYQAIKQQAEAGHPIRIIILKARQMGFSTVSGALIFHRTATQEMTDSFVIAHQEDATANLFGMYRMYYDNLPPEIQPMRRSVTAQELVFENPTRDPIAKRDRPGLRSRIRCATAGGRGVGRSFTAKNVHMSEFAFWPGDKLATYSGVMQSVPDSPDTMVIIESTANGYDDYKTLWDDSVAAWERGERDGYQPIFFAWHEMEEYRRPIPHGFQRTPEEQEIADTYGLDDEQLAWRRWCIRNNCAGSIDQFHQEYPSSPDEAFLASGRCVFDQEAVVLRREQVKGIDCQRGRFGYDYDGLRITNVRWMDDPRGDISIYAQPQEGYPYVLGGDTAGEGSDWFTGHVINNVTGRQVAVVHQESGEGEYIRQMYCLGTYYNTALVGIETNFSTFPNTEMERLGYKNLYVRERADTYTGGTKKSYGFRTDSVTRPLIISKLVELTQDNLDCIVDYDTLGEMLVFVRNDRGRPEAQVGEHDDLVMALAITNHIRGQQSMTVTQAAPELVTWHPSQWEDYYNTNAEGRAYLLKKWGRPKPR